MKTQLPVKISNRALEEILLIKNNKGIPVEYGLRLIADASGCSEVNFRIGFDKCAEDDDEYEIAGFKVYIKKKDFMYLLGVSLDYLETGETQGFTFVK